MADRGGLAFTLFLVGKHLANGDLEGIGFDALNLYALPKAGEVLAAKVTLAADRLEAPALRASAPIIGRTFGERKWDMMCFVYSQPIQIQRYFDTLLGHILHRASFQASSDSNVC